MTDHEPDCPWCAQATAPPAPTETEPETEPAAGAVGSGGLG
jgi:hypothetical protein